MNVITCPHCKQKVEITSALQKELEAHIKETTSKEFEKKLQEQILETEKNATKKITDHYQLEIKLAKEEADEKAKQNKQLLDQLTELSKTLRHMKTQQEETKLEMEKKLLEEEEKIRIEIQKKSEETFHLQLLEKDKKLQDTLHELEETKRKIQQGSQQLQGETFELEFEALLQSHYPNDKILPVGKGIKGGDIIQEVWDQRGNYAGKILWELKNTKNWSEGFIDKLKDDKREINAEEAVLITNTLPSGVKSAAFRNGVWVTERAFVLPLTDTLRAKLIQLYYVRNSVLAKDEKMELLFSYLSGTEFKHRIEAIIEAFTCLQQEIEKEKRYFAAKWAKDEKYIRQIIHNTYSMHGDVKSIVGNSLPQIKGLEEDPDDKTTPTLL